MKLFKRTNISLLITLLGTGFVLAAPVAHASTVMECPGVNDQLSPDSLDPTKVDNGKTTTQLKPTKNVSTNDECATYMATNGTVNVQNGGSTGNVIVQNSGVVNVQTGGTVNGVITAGNYMEAKDGTSSQYGGVGTVSLSSGSTTGGVLIGDGSTLIANGADIGWVKSAGTTNITGGTINPKGYGLGTPDQEYDAAVEINGGSATLSKVTINASDSDMVQAGVAGIKINGDSNFDGPAANLDITINDHTVVTAIDPLNITRNASAPDGDYTINIADSSFTALQNTNTVSGAGMRVEVAGGTHPVAITTSGSTFTGSTGLEFSTQDAGTSLTDTGSTFKSDNTMTTGTPTAAGVGIFASGNGSVALNKSTVIGLEDGITLDTQATGDGTTLTLANGTNVSAGSGSALHIVNRQNNANAVAHVSIESGSTLAADQSGTIIQADGGAKAQVKADNVALTGNIAATGKDTKLDVYAQNQASITGAFNATTGANLGVGATNASLTGDLGADGAGTQATLQLDQNGVFTGKAQAINGATLYVNGTASGAQLHGAISADASTANVQLQNGAQADGGVALSNGATGTVTVSGAGSLLSRADGAAVDVDKGTATINVLDGGHLQGQDGTLVNVSHGSAKVLLSNTVQAGNMTATDGTLDLTLAGSAQLDGNVSEKNGSVVLADNAVLNGNVVGPNVTVGGAATLNGNLDADSLTMADSGTWKLGNAASQSIDTLAMNGGNVDFNSGNGNFKTLSASSLSGSGGTLSMNVDFNPGGGNDQLQVSTVDGTHGLHVTSVNQGVENPRNDITLVQSNGGDGSFNLVGDGKTDAGIYVYDVKQDGNRWELVQSGTLPPTDPTDPTNPTNPDNGNPANPNGPTNNPIPKPKDLSPAAKTALSVASSLPYAFYGELDTLRQREGDLRMNKAGSGLWVRSFASTNKMAQSAAPAYDLDQYGGAFGADKRFLLSSGGDIYVGGFGSYSYNTSDIDGGSSGRTNSAGTGAYVTWMSQGGWYADGTIKANSFGNELRVVGSDGNRTRGKYDNSGFGGSIEVGKHFNLPNKGYIEPYSQVAAFQGSSVNKTLDNGFRIHDDPTRSVRGQLGFQAGTTFEAGKGYMVQPYVKAAVLREFVNSNHVALNGTTISDNLNGNRALVGLGMQAQLKQSLQVYADVDYTSGGPVDHSVSGDVGVRYAF
ncbi:autotransporter outer membrane beta-barrel domain-containing protein [Bordetella sp. LUAb4]|uniref:autotransporter outer membrane beta-barrel domain-containing protein n=1 Tax=Bordetella sp. LUAb4 TaxID=2843195 RepID=UPI001E4BEF44|nr:autotransporter outer membrane beta-barrel domain-containing protein [Bordetella sp. LUAb4]